MAIKDKSKSKKKNKATVAEGASETSRVSRKSVAKDTGCSKSGKRKSCCQKQDKGHVTESKSTTISTSSRLSANAKKSSVVNRHEYQSKISGTELTVKEAAKIDSISLGLAAKDGSSTGEAALKTAEALDLGATGAGCCTSKKCKRQSDTEALELMLGAGLQGTKAPELDAKAALACFSDQSKSMYKKKKGAKAGSETAIWSPRLALNDTALSIAGSRGTRRVVEDCKSVLPGTIAPSSKPRSPMGNGRGLSDEYIEEFLRLGNCANPNHQEAIAEAIGVFIGKYPQGEALVQMLKKGLDAALASSPSASGDEGCMCALIAMLLRNFARLAPLFSAEIKGRRGLDVSGTSEYERSQSLKRGNKRSFRAKVWLLSLLSKL